ncbi:Crp/Fnr family transcriptional regulator [Pedobacter lithocola]|uniref:Crp/Fnr family transcriptional regulator n=1 Tax=Pedobacter lithocola TaxID=1908239 RepID=A0ABV8P577_9SPHI
MSKNLKSHIDQISQLTDEEFDFVLSHFVYKSFKRREYLFKVGDPVKYHYFILSGLLKLVYNTQEGKQHIISFAMENWWESDFNAYCSATNATMSLECLEDTEVLCLPLAGYQTICSSLQKMEHYFLQLANLNFISAQRRVISGMTLNVKEQFEHVQSQYPFLKQRVPKTLIAAYIGVSRETLSRLEP